ncbi:NADP-dependent oxidoreductase [Falsarthrobacter nasiphocae]|uniref:NADPH-dependent curcumin reductase CurA n=1 Tax=Falsarthrobacter nasiphocae TaxID=189863 RepID=A0AAE4C6I0_9MICC|nr:NADP-dependent oxidoreductase [Falsarthrobacter nasiphocae]MDR6891504.1 NADPH-dependent curcumin reductase CurA [Falsarthrobacter nasiphocae]
MASEYRPADESTAPETRPDLPRTSRAVTLASRPDGLPTPADFEMKTLDLWELNAGQVLIENVVMSVDPYMRGRMDDRESYIPPFELGEPLTGGAVGRVIASRADDLPVGTHVQHFYGWRDRIVLDAEMVQPVDTDLAPAEAYLGILGMTGLTAWVGLTVIGRFEKGETVFVSAAAGAVGSAVGQIAKLLGAGRVIGSAGGREKVEYVKSLGFDAVIDYKAGDVAGQLKDAAPDGIDIYFDNVGGEHLEAALASIRKNARIVLCGAISIMNGRAGSTGIRNTAALIGKGATMQGFTVGQYQQDHQEEFYAHMAPWVSEGRIQWKTTQRHGLENAVPAFLELFEGGNTGKMVVVLDESA